MTLQRLIAGAAYVSILALRACIVGGGIIVSALWGIPPILGRIALPTPGQGGMTYFATEPKSE